MQASDAREAYKLFSSFVRELSHRIRTPLSVVTNDLFYFRSLLPADANVERTEAKCREVAEIIGTLHRSNDSEFTFKLHSLSELSEVYTGLIAQPDAGGGASTTFLEVDAEKMALFFQLLSEVVPNLTGPRWSLAESHVLLLFSGLKQTQVLNSIGDLAHVQGLADSFRAHLADVLLWAHSGSVKIEQGTLSVSLPRVSADVRK